MPVTEGMVFTSNHSAPKRLIVHRLNMMCMFTCSMRAADPHMETDASPQPDMTAFAPPKLKGLDHDLLL